ncbi:nucleotide exchange factor GrpE [Prevotella sp. E15-22]|jgi:molecular chaperone GrpE|uniref:nucleotide exchange factor GrpE n=1 Tax=Prevotella sp. E15-22 TaxID=2937774 RepID=UPI00204A5D92|nr:nucleotide exchange factor GrpE [Prevotella sp. E15-22]UPS45630.1 nucleotide exchange factor GrpE [Prevotella sp. E15-22]
MEEKKKNTEKEEVLTDKEACLNDTNEEVEVAENSTETDAIDSAEVEEEEDPMEKLLAQIADLKDKYLRQVAEFDNYRKRTLKERQELIFNGGAKAITALLPVIDDMERAIANGAKTDDPQVLREGMELIYQKFIKILEEQGVSKIETENADFDTNLHEAIALVPGMGEDKKGKVIDCMATGYKLNDKVIRYAKVAVGQ